MTSPTDMAQRQLDAYNARDIEAFLACYAPDVEVRDFPSGALTMEGREAMRARYGDMFARCPDLHARLVSRTAKDQVVIDTEAVTGIKPDEVVDAIAIYEVAGELIQRVWFVRPR